MTGRRVLIGILVLVALGWWWAARFGPKSLSTAEGPRPTAQHAKSGTKRRPSAAAVATFEPETSVPASAWRVVVRVVRADDGSPVGGAEVVVAPDAGRERAATTDADGVARVEDDSKSGSARIVVRAKGFVREIVGFFSLVELKRGATTDVTVELRPATAMTGVVLDPDGKPLAGATLLVEGASMHAEREPDVAWARSGADGRFRLEGLPASGRARVRVDAARFAMTHVVWDAATAARDVEIRMSRGARFVGVVRGADGRPAEGAVVRAWITALGSVQMDEAPVEPQATTDADGKYAIEALPFGATWSVAATKTGHGDAEPTHGLVLDASRTELTIDFALKAPSFLVLTVLTADGRRVLRGDLIVQTSSGRVIHQGVDLTKPFELQSPFGSVFGIDAREFPPKEFQATVAPGERRALEVRLDEDASISGVVVDDLGAPIDDVQLETSAGVTWTFGAVERSTTSAADGTFTLRGLAAGRHHVNAWIVGHESAIQREIGAPARETRIVLARQATVTLNVRAAPGAKRASGFHVAVRRPTDYQRWLRDFAWTDDAVAVPVDPGPWRVEVSADGFKTSRELAVEARPGERHELGVVTLAAEESR